MGKHLVLVGGGHAHMLTLARLQHFIQQGHRVTVIGPSEHHYYSGMGPGMLSGIYSPQQIRFATRKVVEKQGGVFIRAQVARIDPETRVVYTGQGDEYHYDVLSFNAGSYVPADIAAEDNEDIYTAKPIERLLQAQQKLQTMARSGRVSVGVVGGGAAAVEIAGNAWRLLSDQQGHGHEVALFSRGGVLERFPERVRAAGRRSLRRRGIRCTENSAVTQIENKKIQLESGASFACDMIFLATGVKPSPIFKESNLPVGSDGGLAVNTYLQSTAYPTIFGGGDCIYFTPQPLDKVGVYAVRQNPVLYHNLMAALEEKPLMPFAPGGAYLLIFNMGDGTGILYKQGLLVGGRLAFWIKDLIDRRFMRKFQAAE